MEQTVEKPVETVDNQTATEPAVNYETLYYQAAESIKELTAERDSLKNENTELRSARDQAISDGQKAREMNYTLSRQLAISQNVKKQPEELMAGMFLNKKGD